MTADAFRRLALALPDTIESAHMGHPDFRVPASKGRIFASLGPPDGPRGRTTWAMVKLGPAQQAAAIASHPEALAPASGAWGRQGCTIITLSKARQGLVRGLLQTAWRAAAPKRLVEAIDEQEAEMR
ncbi:MAG: MmcQ/YjbR family DNA-binding protein [Phycisphaeraceae bacterium]|nr:MmcQ/YjbR family DNA-binding protein [Phycisphaerales bacterium]QOJ17843.1 MAG: MmcQ/YjbR family DNA-binding protein [Phycisphaeraceae bacterium]